MQYARCLTGSLAAVVLFAAGALLMTAPAAAQGGGESVLPVVVKIASATIAGTYKVSWQTFGDCDPGHGTSGSSGEIVLTVEASGSGDDTPAPGELTGIRAVSSVVIRPICTYTWLVSFVEATTGANCIVGPAPFAPDGNHEIRITLADPATSCTQSSRIVVRLHPVIPVAIDGTDHNAILRTRFSATARRVEDAPRRCRTRTARSEVDDQDTPDDTTDDTVSIELRVVETTAAGEDCVYDVTLRLPRHLAATHGPHTHEVFENVDPLATVDFNVGVATKTIYLLQNVIGDSGDANVRYTLSKTCGDPDPMPEAMLPNPPSGGIQSTPTETAVELREGRFNVTAALADDPSADDAFDGFDVRVLDQEGETCEATVSVLHLPERCVAEESSLTVELTRTPDNTILEFEITCGDDVDNVTEQDADGDADGNEGDGDGENTGDNEEDKTAKTPTPPAG